MAAFRYVKNLFSLLRKRTQNLFQRKSKEERLCILLEKAADKLDRLGIDPNWSSYDTGIHMATFIRNRIPEIQNGTIAFEQKYELWGIFVPTCDWDDTVGDVSLGDKIYALLNKLYGVEIKNKIQPEE